MTPTDLRNIIKQWKVKNNGDVNTIFTDEFSNSTTDKLRNNDNSPNAAGANRLISNDMVKNNPGKIVSSEIKKYIKDRDIPDSNGYSGTPPSAAFKTDFNAYYSGDNVDNGPEEPKGVKLYLGDPSTVKGQRMNQIGRAHV